MWHTQIVHSIDKLGLWHRLPVFFGLLYLGIRRHLQQQYNLFNVGTTPVGIRFNPSDFPYRTDDGKYNDPFNEVAGSQGSFFGRNILPVDHKNKVHNFHLTLLLRHLLFSLFFSLFFSFFLFFSCIDRVYGV